MNLIDSSAHPPTLDQHLFEPFTTIGPADISQTHNSFENLRTNCKYFCLPDQASVGIQEPLNVNHPNVDVSIIHVNARSILSDDKFSEFQVFLHLTKNRWSLICVSETWLHRGSEQMRSLDGYTCYFDNRDAGVGGGVAVYARNNCFKEIRKMPSIIKCTESIHLECHLSGSLSIILFMIYKPPNLSHHTFCDEFGHALDFLSAKDKTVFICGDFNYDLLKMSQNNQTLEFFNVLASTGYLPIISKPTRVYDSGASLIDNMFCNNLSLVKKSGVIFDDTSDHFPIFAIINKQIESKGRTRETKLNFDYSKIPQFTNDLIQSLEGFADITDPEEACDALLQAYSTAQGKYSYHHEVNRKNCAIKPWISPAILASITQRSKLFALKHKYPTPENKRKYTKFRNILNDIIKCAKKNYVESQLELNKNDAKQMWNVLNKFAIGKCTTSHTPKSFKNTNGEILDNPHEIAEGFNTFFSSIGQKLQGSIDPCPGSPLAFINVCNNQVTEAELTNHNELIQIITNMKNVGAGMDNINGKLFKLTYKSIIHHIVHLLNCCLRVGIFPKKLKIAVIKPIFKSGERANMNNYRPISILPYLSKVLEKIIHLRMMNHITNNEIISSSQFGFRKGHSTYMPLLILQDKIMGGFENNKLTCGIYLDLKKAFDTVDHSILLSKLNAYGFSDKFLHLIKSYLNDRYQCVEHQNIKSCMQNITIGVPQGSILGPLLFILYINDLPNVCEQASTLLYADDTAIFFQSDNAGELQNMLNSNLPMLCKWFQINKLSLNASKSFFQLYNISNQNIKIDVSLNGVIIEHADTVRYLGMLIDTNLKWKSHVDHIAAILSRNVGIMNRSKFFLGRKHLLLLYNSLVLPYLNYCCLIWGNSAQSTINKLFILQKKAVRIIESQDRIAHSNPIFVKLQLLKLKDIAKQQSLLVMHSVIRQEAPTLIKSLFNLSPMHHRESRISRHFNEPFTRKLYRIRTIAWFGPRLWNSSISPIFPRIDELPLNKQIIKEVAKRQALVEYTAIMQ